MTVARKPIHESEIGKSLFLSLVEEQEHFNDGDGDETIYVIELRDDTGCSIIHFCEGYGKEAIEVVFCIMKDNITDYIDFSLLTASKNGRIILKVNEEKLR